MLIELSITNLNQHLVKNGNMKSNSASNWTHCDVLILGCKTTVGLFPLAYNKDSFDYKIESESDFCKIPRLFCCQLRLISESQKYANLEYDSFMTLWRCTKMIYYLTYLLSYLLMFICLIHTEFIEFMNKKKSVLLITKIR